MLIVLWLLHRIVISVLLFVVVVYFVVVVGDFPARESPVPFVPESTAGVLF